MMKLGSMYGNRPRCPVCDNCTGRRPGASGPIVVAGEYPATKILVEDDYDSA